MFNKFNSIFNFITTQTVPAHRTLSIFGVFLMFIILHQMYTGIVSAFYTVNDSLLLVISRDEADMEELYSDDVFNLHERGVDFTFILLYLHFLRKFFLKAYFSLQWTTWKSGSFMFLLLHGVIFFGLVLCCTHLSDITLKIAANIVQTIFFKYGQVSYWIFTNHTINTDSLIRVMYLHYILPMVLWVFIVIHLVDMHYGYKNSFFFKNIHQSLNWYGEVLKNEILSIISFLSLFCIISLFVFKVCEPLSYELFMWGDIGLITDVRFLSVAPHWYFRAYMGWLLFCPHHYIGIFGLIFFLVFIYFQPNVFGKSLKKNNFVMKVLKQDKSSLSLVIFFTFLICLLYSGSFLPCGKYFTFLGGNKATTFSYIFIFLIWFLPIETPLFYTLNKFFFKKKPIILLCLIFTSL